MLLCNKGQTSPGPAANISHSAPRDFSALWLTPGYIAQVWNLPALSGVLIGGIPLEELLFGFSFGWYWTGVYEHFTSSTSVTRRWIARPDAPDAKS